MLDKLKDIAGLVRDVGVIVGVPTVIAVGMSLHDIQIKALEQQAKASESQVKAAEAQIKANEAQVRVLEAQNTVLKETQFDRAIQLIKGQKEVYEVEREGLLKSIAELRQSGDRRVAELEERLRNTTVAITRSNDAISVLGKTAVGASGDVSIRYGLSEEELARVLKSFNDSVEANSAKRAAAERRIQDITAQLGFTKAAIQNFFQTLGEQDVSLDDLPAKLSELASQYNQLRQAQNKLPRGESDSSAGR